jgi:hypothetical protein
MDICEIPGLHFSQAGGFDNLHSKTIMVPRADLLVQNEQDVYKTLDTDLSDCGAHIHLARKIKWTRMLRATSSMLAYGVGVLDAFSDFLWSVRLVKLICSVGLCPS